MDGYYDRVEAQLRALTETGAHRRARARVAPTLGIAAATAVVVAVVGVFLVFLGARRRSHVPPAGAAPACTRADWRMTRIPAIQLDRATVAGVAVSSTTRCHLRLTISFDLVNRSGCRRERHRREHKLDAGTRCSGRAALGLAQSLRRRPRSASRLVPSGRRWADSAGPGLTPSVRGPPRTDWIRTVPVHLPKHSAAESAGRLFGIPPGHHVCRRDPCRCASRDEHAGAASGRPKPAACEACWRPSRRRVHCPRRRGARPSPGRRLDGRPEQVRDRGGLLAESFQPGRPEVITGVVPDGVAEVTFVLTSGVLQIAPVHQNLYHVVLHGHARTLTFTSQHHRITVDL